MQMVSCKTSPIMNNTILSTMMAENHQNCSDPKASASDISPTKDLAPGTRYSVGVTIPLRRIAPRNTERRHFHLSVTYPVRGLTTMFSSNNHVKMLPTTDGEYPLSLAIVDRNGLMGEFPGKTDAYASAIRILLPI